VTLGLLLGAQGALGCGSEDGGSAFREKDPAATQKSGSAPGTVDPGFGEAPAGETTGPQCAATSISAKKGSVDIIFVIDQSGSMDSEIGQVKATINSFAQSIGQSGLDYRVVMIARKATGPADTNRYRICVAEPLAGPGCASKPPTFTHVDQEIDSFNALQQVLLTYPQYRDALREDSTKVIIPITDDNSTRVSAADFDAQLLALGTTFGTAEKRRYIMHGIIGVAQPVLQTRPDLPISTATCNVNGNRSVNASPVYQQVINLTGGIQESVCNSNYDAVFTNIAKGIQERLGCEFQVPTADGAPADPEKVVVQFTGGGGAAKSLTRVTDASKCASNPDAWHYDTPTAPTKIVLCASTCTAVSAEATGKLDVLLGCAAPAPR
jgi:hypothetical protein